MKSTALTKNQARAFGYIKDFIDYKEYAPTTEEIATFMGSSNRNTGLSYIQALRTKGAVRFDEGRRGSLRPVKGFKVIIKGEAK